MITIIVVFIVSVSICTSIDRYCTLVERLAELENRDESNDV